MLNHVEYTKTTIQKQSKSNAKTTLFRFKSALKNLLVARTNSVLFRFVYPIPKQMSNFLLNNFFN